MSSGSAPSGEDTVGKIDPKAPAPLFDIGRVDPSEMDPSKASAASSSSGASLAGRASVPPKDAPVTAVSSSGDFDTDTDAPVKANGFASVKLAGKNRGSKRVGVKVDVRDQAETAKLGAQKLSLSVARTDDGTEAEDVEVTLNYDSFRDAFGSDAIYRLRVVQLPACQGQAGCKDPVVPVAATNDFTNGALKVTLSLKPKPAVAPVAVQASVAAPPQAAAAPVASAPVTSLALVAASTGDSGNYTATPLTGSTKWDVSGNSGAFNWSYPFSPVPATGPTPSMSLGYNSQMVDDLTANSNTQGGLAGPGWDLMGGGYIERSYRSCSSDTPAVTGKSDLCWVLDAGSGTVVGGGIVDNQVGYSINLNGKVSPLLKQGTTNNFVLKTDPLWKVNDAATGTAVTTGAGSPTADNDGEHFTVKTPDGWTYEFGSDPNRNSVWAANARGPVSVFQGDNLRIGNAFAKYEWPSLLSNPNVTAINAIVSSGEKIQDCLERSQVDDPQAMHGNRGSVDVGQLRDDWTGGVAIPNIQVARGDLPHNRSLSHDQLKRKPCDC